MIFSQKFNFHNLRVYARGDDEEKPMNEFNFGEIIDTFCSTFPECIPQSDKIKCIIDNQFENKT